MSATLQQAPSPLPVIVTEGKRAPRPVSRGKFLWAGSRKLCIRGVTYGTFRPDAEGHEYPPYEVVDRDFRQMAACGVNAVRTYTPPPVWLLDLAASHGLHVMVGLAIERYIGYLIDTKAAPDFVATTRELVRGFAGHPSILCFAIANENGHVHLLDIRVFQRLLDDLVDVVPFGVGQQ